MCLVNDRTRWTLSPPPSAAIYIRPLIKTLTVVMRCWHFQHLRREVHALQERRQQNKREPQQHTKTTPTLFFLFSFVYWGIEEKTHPICTNLYIACNKSGRIHAGHDENSHTHTYNLYFFKRPSVLWLRFVREFVCRSFVGVRVQQDNTFT